MIDLSKYENLYDTFDAGHDRNHMIAVRNRAVKLAKKYAPDMVKLAYIAATLHDIGISVNREEHELNGEKMILEDNYLKSVLSEKEIKEIAHAVREHRSSNGQPKTMLAKIISDADKTPPTTTKAAFLRGFHFGRKYFPELTVDQELLRCAKHLSEKFSQENIKKKIYFPETIDRMERIFSPIIKAYQDNDLEYLRSLVAR